MTDLTSLTIAEARDRLAAKDFTALELTDAYLAAIDGANGALKTFGVDLEMVAQAPRRTDDHHRGQVCTGSPSCINVT